MILKAIKFMCNFIVDIKLWNFIFQVFIYSMSNSISLCSLKSTKSTASVINNQLTLLRLRKKGIGT